MLGLPPLPRNIGAALRDAEHAEARVRQSALGDLVRHARASERERATIAIIGLLRSDPNPELRAEAALALADAGATGARTALLAALEDPALGVRQMAILALGELGEPGDLELAERLAGALVAVEPALRFQSLIACERLVPERGEAFLARALSDDDEEVRGMALRLARKRWPEADAPRALVNVAVKALGDQASNVRAQAALWLGLLGDARADDALVGIVDGSVSVALPADLEEAMDLVAARRLARASLGLERRAFGFFARVDTARWHALVALARLGHARARRTILRGLGAWTRDARTLAVVAAGRAGLSEASPRISLFRGRPGRADPEAVEDALRVLRPATLVQTARLERGD
jgi:HEAT repeat protein